MGAAARVARGAARRLHRRGGTGGARPETVASGLNAAHRTPSSSDRDHAMA